MIRQQLTVNTMVVLLLCMIASFDVSGSGVYREEYGAFGLFLPLVMKQEAPTLIPTAMVAPTATATLAATPVPTLIPTPTSGSQCHASYPTVCIPPPPPDLDCKDISPRRFTVLPPDPHNFDSDHDGIGCES